MNAIDPCSLFGPELARIQKPARYLGGENGSILKPEANLRIALCFPDMYEIGMANNAMRILYASLNALDGVSCERVFSVAPDYEALLRKSNTPLYSLESGTPIGDFDIVAFTVGYELAATNILGILDLAGIALFATERTETTPIIIAGGPAITNPVPYSKILDAVWIGEAENRFFELIAELREAKRAGAARNALLDMIRAEQAIWVPGKRAIRNIFNDFETAPYRYAFPAPVVKPIQDHGVVEIMRGCPNGCRFCHAGYFYRPRRARSIERIFEDVETQIRVAGHREISLSSLSSGDYPGIVELLGALNHRWKREGISFQLPSLKVESFPLELLDDLSGTRKSGLTFAVETPLDQWQMTINKRVSIDKIKSILIEAERRGYKVAKFYFMIGLPLASADISEENAIIDFIREISRSTRTVRINCTVATFVPKPHTPFQWSAQLADRAAASRIYAIKDAFRGDSRVKISYHAPYLSWLEGIVARGDERVGDLIVSAFSKGARFDAWDDLFDKSAWQGALAEWPHDPEQFAASERDPDERLPWSDISLRVSTTFLKKERQRAIDATMSPPCAAECMAPCGACSDSVTIRDPIDSKEKITGFIEQSDRSTDGSDVLTEPRPDEHFRLLFKYTKLNKAAYFAHQEIRAMISSALERAGMRLEYSQGFNPMPRLEISEPLSLGYESEEEYGVTIVASRPLESLEAIITRANRLLHIDMQIKDSLVVPIIDGKHFVSLSAMHWGSRFSIFTAGTSIDPSVLATAITNNMALIPVLSESTLNVFDDHIDLALQFTGKREYGLSTLFEQSAGIAVRDSGVRIVRREQYARLSDDATTGHQSYFECYTDYYK
ncbi:MAG TPA: DUF2344 domain-containing protein [bacterium]|nr:DUF2344 domain-containing protein [bacterium]